MTKKNNNNFRKVLIENLNSLLFALIAATLIRSFAYEPFRIPSSSMKPTLLIGDFLFVNKYIYGFSKHSLPFSPNLWDGRVLKFGKPKRGDIVVFHKKNDDSTYYIKRIVGLPGDKIQMRGGVLFINNNPVPKRFEDVYSDEEYKNVAKFIEKIDGKEFYVLDVYENGALDNTEKYNVPENHYFMMGDNRDFSNDSRLDIGFVPEENIVGRADVIFFSISDSFLKFWEWPNSIRINRILNLL
ncbi:MAG: signal peptidase I [Sphingobacteriia bacterium]|nr:signal peptidase I [Sphingobacteriia bacterium]